MAAVLKKRAVAEFSHVIQEEEQQAPPPKRLRLIYRPKPTNAFELHAGLSSREVLQALLELERSLPVDADQLQPVVSCLLERFGKETESAVRAKIASLLGLLGKTAGYNPLNLVDDIVNLLKVEKSHTVLSQLLTSLLSISQSVGSGNTKLHRLVVDSAYRFLNDTSHLVRCKCLELIGAIGSPDHRQPSTPDQPLPPLSTGGSTALSKSTAATSILGAFSRDPDSRVRTQAFRSMLMWHERGLKLDQSVYAEACRALTDDHEGVRVVAVKLVWVFCQLYPDFNVNVADSHNSLRLIDDGFGKICNMVNDISLRVRAKAAGLLGSLNGVSHHFLEQTLDKKLMSNMREKRSAHMRQQELYECGEWSTGQKWADDAPKDSVDPDAVNIISNGACGAFVHGLEDEFLEVRNAAIESLCRLAAESPTFAKLSQDFLVDVFNDEIESVRLNAIHSLSKICHHFLLREDQLEIILCVLKDSNHEIRESLHEMLCRCHVSMKECLSIIVLTLLDNLNRYPQDRQSIWRCMMHLGQNHESLVLALTPDLLSSHPYFESIEPDVDDPAYVSILVMVFNAAVNSPTMLPLFPGHLASHYTYLRNMLPDLIPRLALLGVSHFDGMTSLSSVSAMTTTSFLSQTLRRLDSLSIMNRTTAIRMMQIGIRDLHQVELIEPGEAATAQCIALHLRCQLLFDKAVETISQADSIFTSPQDVTHQLVLISKIENLLLRIEHQFMGLGVAELATIHHFGLRTLALRVLAILRDGGTTESTVKKKKQICSQFLSSLLKLQEMLTSSASSDCPPDQFTTSLLDELSTLRSCDPVVYKRVLLASISRGTVAVLKLDGSQLHKVHATLTEPTENSEVPLKFTAGLTAAVGLTATLNSVRNIDRIRIQVRYPDQQTHLVAPPTLDFRQLSLFKYKLITKVLLSHVLWSEPSAVQLCIVLLCPTDDSTNGCLSSNTHRIELCRPVPVTISPVPPKR